MNSHKHRKNSHVCGSRIIIAYLSRKSKRFFAFFNSDEYSRFHYLKVFEEHSTYSSVVFLRHVVEKFPYAIACVQTDNGSEFTNRLNSSKADRPTLF